MQSLILGENRLTILDLLSPCNRIPPKPESKKSLPKIFGGFRLGRGWALARSGQLICPMPFSAGVLR